MFPQWIDRAAALAGPVLGLPLVVTYGGSIVVGNAIGVEAPFAVESAIVGLGVALSVAWAFFLVGRAVLLLGLSAGSKSEATKT
ncbi:hypothetical protein [Halorussus halophilus]|uniref:hypothetical protein n=1 Tax=Halorussus halophilus TaxID=2650975 RepID=UPI001301519F|nr:hypothetical protein [Halorussus halophilus]